MRKAFVFTAAFGAVLIAGAAFAFMATPGGDVADAAEEVVEEESTTTSTFHEEEKEDPPAPAEEEKKEEPKETDPPQDTEGPEFVILHPEDGTHTTSGEIAYEGETEPGSRVFIADKEIEVDPEGHWLVVLGLEIGSNPRIFHAVDEAGNKSADSVTVWRDKIEEPKAEEPKAEEPKKEEPKDIEFWAKQKYGSCGEAEPYDKWYGMGEPGTKIWIVSDFGEGFTEIGKTGEWHLKVFFSPDTAPCNEQFKVVLETDKGHRKVYEFIRWCEEKHHEDPPPEEGHGEEPQPEDK